MQHHFDIEIAKEYGMLEAIILNHMEYWISKNEANKTNYYDGYYWTYNSMKALSKLFPYATTRQLRYAIQHLQDEGIIQTGNYNKVGYDRTLWYALTDFGKCICQNCQMDLTPVANGFDTSVKPIPYNNTYNNTDNNIKRFTPPTVDEVKKYCKERKNNVDPERFVDFYSSKGWKVGNQPMKDWKAAVRTWEKRETKGYSNQREYDYDELERKLHNA